MSEPVAELFEEELRRRGASFRLDSGSARYVVLYRGFELFVSLDNLAREYARDQDASAVVPFVDTVLSISFGAGSWEDARPSILLCLEPSDYAEPPEFSTAVSGRLLRVPVRLNASTGAIKWISQTMLDAWQVTLDLVNETASSNLADALADAKFEYRDIDGVRLGFVSTVLPFKSALILAPNLRDIVAPLLGWPLCAVVPDRDFLYLWDAQHIDFADRVGRVVVDQFTTAPHPLTTEVFEIDDAGISAIGAFPISA
jgi:hypothetical protein